MKPRMTDRKIPQSLAETALIAGSFLNCKSPQRGTKSGMKNRKHSISSLMSKWKDYLKAHIKFTVIGFLLFASIATIVVWQLQQNNSNDVVDDAWNNIEESSEESSEKPPPTRSHPLTSPTVEPTPIPQRGINPRFLALREELGNDDIIGYIKIDGTSVDYPVVQNYDNKFYLDHNLNKESDRAGWIFMDYENDVFRTDPNTIIYGHNMRADYMFHSLRKYRDKSFWEKHRYFVFDSLYDEQVWEIFCVYVAPTSFYYIQVYFEGIDDFSAMLEQMREYQIYDTGIAVDKNDRVLTLSTCTGSNDDERFVVSARLVTDPEIIVNVRNLGTGVY